MASQILDLVRITRTRLREISPRAWTDTDLLDIMNLGIKDLWRRICDTHNNHFLTINTTDVYLAANTEMLYGIPDDCYRIVNIRPRTVGENNPNRSLIFKPANGLNDPRYINAQARGPVSPNSVVIWYVVVNEGAPVGAPTILIAPMVSDRVLIRLLYNQTLRTYDDTDQNPIPGESDNALIAWTVAYARADERDDRSPDPEWLAVYGTEKTNIIKEIGPRQVQEPNVVVGMFEDGEEED